MKIGISGFGFVGGALFANIVDTTNTVIYDPGMSDFMDNKDKLLNCDVIFVCVGTPLKNGEMDSSAVNENLIFLNDNNYKGIVVIKSTIHPEYLLKAPLKFLNVVSNPEFLDEHKALDDFKNQDLIIIGGRIDLCKKLENVYETEFSLITKYHFMSFEEALIFKYLRNIKIAYDVMFWEFVQDTTGNYRKYKKTLEKLPVEISTIRSDGLPGFGGHCLIKDATSYPQHELTEFLLSYNKSIRI